MPPIPAVKVWNILTVEFLFTTLLSRSICTSGALGNCWLVQESARITAGGMKPSVSGLTVFGKRALISRELPSRRPGTAATPRPARLADQTFLPWPRRPLTRPPPPRGRQTLSKRAQQPFAHPPPFVSSNHVQIVQAPPPVKLAMHSASHSPLVFVYASMGWPGAPKSTAVAPG